MIEIIHDASEALALLSFVSKTHEVLNWHFDVVKKHQCCSSTTRVSCFDWLGFHTHVTRDEEHADPLPTLARPYCCDKVICKHAVCDPFLDAIDDVKLPIRRLLCCRQQACNIA